MNSFTLIGKLYGKYWSNKKEGDPINPDGKGLVVRFSIGEYDQFKEEMKYYRCVCFGKHAIRMIKCFEPKRVCYVQGRLDAKKFTKKGTDVEVDQIDLVVLSMSFPENGPGVVPIAELYKDGSRPDTSTHAGGDPVQLPLKDEPPRVPDDPDDLPF